MATGSNLMTAHVKLPSVKFSTLKKNTKPSNSRTLLFSLCSFVSRTRHVAVRLAPDSGGPTYPLEVLMLTLLHEFAHVMAPSLLRKGGPKGREWREDAHGPEFYAAFASVLHAAERLSLFVLPSAPNKHSPHSLSRLDRYEASSGLLPHSCVPTATRARLWSGGQDGEAEGEGPPQRISCRVTVAHVNRGKTVRKPLVVHAEMEMGEFMEQVRAKLRLAKTPEVVRNQRGDAWDGFSLSMIHPDMILWF